MSLRDPVLILDCQTTGMRPSTGRILEIGWSLVTMDDIQPQVKSWLLKVDELPVRIREITGIGDEQMKTAEDSSAVFMKWKKLVTDLSPSTRAVAHYAQFEKAFLQDWHERNEDRFDLDMICSQRIAKKLFPEIPSQNLRGLAGFFGDQLSELKRAPSHVQATITVWRAIVARLQIMGIHDFDAVKAWLKEKPKAKGGSPRYQYRMDRLQRLALPDKPGIYRMLAQDGRILYVGKATSLKSRVNSYFRGQKNRDRRKLEMLAQVYDLKITECETPLEAALLETDEIKKWDPPYNVSLKTGDRRLLFYSRDFVSESEIQSDKHPIGPFRPMGILQSLKDFHVWRTTGEPRLIFYQEIEEDLLQKGLALFCDRHGLSADLFERSSLRQCLALACRNLRQFFKTYPKRDPEAVFIEQKKARQMDGEGQEEPTPDDIAGKFERLFLRSALALRRAKQLTRLRNTDVVVPGAKGERRLCVRDGQIGLLTPRPLSCKKLPWAGATIGDYDRMSVLLSEASKRSYRIETPAE